MGFSKYRLRKHLWIYIVLISIALSAGSCQRARYRKMIKKRRTGHVNKKTHRSEYQKKLRKSTISTSSKYYIKNHQRNYRRRPWYDK
jgi:hypothetical protein